MRIVAISDTHGRHASLQLPDGDVLVHAGDFSSRGREDEIASFAAWLNEQPHAHKVVIAGNHDFLFQHGPGKARAVLAEHCPDAIYLEDSGVEIAGARFWGSPWQPRFFDWAFNLDRGAPIAEKWALIPEDTDVLITHGPPFGVLDLTVRGVKAGCEELLREVRERIKPRVHIFGHIHEGYGIEQADGVSYLNASSLDVRYEPVNAPLVWQLD